MLTTVVILIGFGFLLRRHNLAKLRKQNVEFDQKILIAQPMARRVGRMEGNVCTEIPPMVTEKELANLEIPTFLRTKKAGNKRVAREVVSIVGTTSPAEKLASSKRPRKRSNKSQKKDEASPAVVQVQTAGAEAALLLPDTPVEGF